MSTTLASSRSSLAAGSRRGLGIGRPRLPLAPTRPRLAVRASKEEFEPEKMKDKMKEQGDKMKDKMMAELEQASQQGGERVYEAPSRLLPAFTRKREHLVGRVAMLGLASAWVGEVITGMGPIHQLSAWTGVSPTTCYVATVALAGANLLLGLRQDNSTWARDNQADVHKRRKGLTGITAIEPDATERINPVRQPGKFLLRSEIVLGRVAMLGFATACVLEWAFSGESPLAHYGLITPNVPITEAPRWLLVLAAALLLGALGVYSNFGRRKDTDTY